MAGIKETKELIEFAVTFGNALVRATDDGKFDFSDIALLVPVAIKAPDAFTGIGEVGKELEDLTTDEILELHKIVEAIVVERNSETEEIVEQAFRSAIELAKLVALLSGGSDEEESVDEE